MLFGQLQRSKFITLPEGAGAVRPLW